MSVEGLTNYTCRFRGKVQGVGFRAACIEVAKDFTVAGYVRNEADGSVWLEVEGNIDQVKAFLEELKKRMTGNILSIDVHDGVPKGFEGFVIEEF